MILVKHKVRGDYEKSRTRMKPFPGEGTLGSLFRQSRVFHLMAQTQEAEASGDLEPSLHRQPTPTPKLGKHDKAPGW